jgi:2-methylisocitrate lyase-like PEP mutase family enzyme
MRFFVPCVTHAEDITAIVRHVPLPLNVMCMPELADFSTLSALGVNEFRWAILFMLPHSHDWPHETPDSWYHLN